MSIGPTEIILTATIVVLLFGGKKFPELMRGIGQGVREFKNASRDEDDIVNNKLPDQVKN